MVAAEWDKKKLAKPKPKVVKTLTEAQRILAEQPQTTSREIGHHKVPVVNTDQSVRTHGRARQLSEYHKLQKTIPKLSSGEVGFHPAYSRARDESSSEAQSLARSIDREHVRKDPELKAGLDALRERVLRVSEPVSCSRQERMRATQGTGPGHPAACVVGGSMLMYMYAMAAG
eukprot:scaffold27835_cov122-Isochrysis_galbana.AAC.1